jgi:hypothetical protein
VILWTANAKGSDNTIGRLPFIAPMKVNFLKSAVFKNQCRCAVALLALMISIWFALTSGAAQSRNQKRITSIQVGEVSEGSRVTVVSDSALNDYEAFRRGDRFYVRIPLAEFTSGQPHFRGDGFEDVQVQKVGDSVVVSFKLQPGATARVDQRSNRLEVIFSAPNRVARGNRTNAEVNRGTYIPTDGIVRLRNPQALQHRDRDAAGPIPPGSPGSPQVTRERVAGRVTDSQTPKGVRVTNPREYPNRRASNRPTGNTGTSQSEPSPGVSKRETSSSVSKTEASLSLSKPQPSTTVVPPPSPGYQGLVTTTPAAPVVSQPVARSPGSGVSQIGKRWSDIARQWISANRQKSLLGALLLLGILVVLAALLFRRRKKGVKAKQADAPLAQPKHSPDVALNSLSAAAPVNSPASSMAPRDFFNENPVRSRVSELTPSAVPVASAKGRQTNETQEDAERGKPIPKPAMARSAGAVAAPQNQGWVPTSPSKGSTADEDQEREVFEL